MHEKDMLQHLPPEELKGLAYHLEPFTNTQDPDQLEQVKSFQRDFPALEKLGRHLGYVPTKDGTEYIGTNLKYGSDKFSLAVINWLKSPEAKPAERARDTLTWLGSLQSPAIEDVIGSEIIGVLSATPGLTVQSGTLEQVTESLEHELESYKAFIEIGLGVEEAAREDADDEAPGQIARTGALLAGLAIKKTLDNEEVESLETQFSLNLSDNSL